MNDMSTVLPGLDGIRARFLTLLQERQALIAQHAVAAWESDTPAGQCANLDAAQAVLHQIAGTAGSLGFHALGDTARACEGAMIDHVENAQNQYLDLPAAIVENLDAFLSESQTLLAQAQ